MKIISFLAACLLCIWMSQIVFSASAVGKVFVYNASEVQNSPDGGGGGGGGSSRNITVYNINIANGTITTLPEQIILPTPIVERNESKRKILFDIGVRIAKKQVTAGENLTTMISLINLGVPGRVNVTAVYRIIDSSGNTVYEENEVVSVETQLEFLEDFNTINFEEGEYTLLAEIKYEGQKEPARADDTFMVKKTFLQKFGRLIWLIILETILIGLIIWFAIKDVVYLKILAKKVHAHVNTGKKKSHAKS